MNNEKTGRYTIFLDKKTQHYKGVNYLKINPYI